MTPISRRAFCALAACAAIPALAAAETDWPVKPVTLLVAGGAGGVLDIRARWIAPRLAAILGQPVVVENRPGAGGNLGTSLAARSAPDGYTLVMIHQGTMSVNPQLTPGPGYSPRDFTPITRLGYGSLALVVHPKVPAQNVTELIQLMKARDGGLNYSSPGVGTPPHLATELFKLLAGVKATHVPYKGGGQAASDLIGGHVDFSIEGLQVTAPLIKEGRVRLLAVSGPKRVASLPDTPTISEAGVPGYAYEGWTGMAAPAGTSRAIIDKVHKAVAAIANTDEGREFFAKVGAEAGAEPPDVFAAFLREDYERMGRVVREAGIKGD
jgi:tripartite-type tricarboxylate transporter receptor subunit TctC